MIKLNILCLHGFTQNSQVFSNRTAVLRKDLKGIADLHYLSAPHSLEPANATQFNLLKNTISSQHDPKEQRAWFIASEDGTIYDGYEDSINYLIDNWTGKHYDGIIAFSQGATMTTLFCAEIIQRNITTLPKFVMLFSGPITRSLSCLQMLSNLSSSANGNSLFNIPSLHVIGHSDNWVIPERSEAMAKLYKNPQLCYHPGSHFVPTNAEQRRTFVEFIGKHVPCRL